MSSIEPRSSQPKDGSDLSIVVISLLKGVVEQSSDPRHWSMLLKHQAQVRDFVSVLALELAIDEAEGYAFLRSKIAEDDETIPRLVVRRPLSFQVSLLLALLRKKMLETEAAAGGTRLVLTTDEIAELLRVFLKDTTNEAKLVQGIEELITKVVNLGFLRKLKTADPSSDVYEVRRILKAFVDAQWLADFDTRLAEYRAVVASNDTPKEND